MQNEYDRLKESQRNAEETLRTNITQNTIRNSVVRYDTEPVLSDSSEACISGSGDEQEENTFPHNASDGVFD